MNKYQQQTSTVEEAQQQLVGKISSAVFAILKPQLKQFIREQVADQVERVCDDEMDRRITAALDDSRRGEGILENILDSRDFSDAVEEAVRNIDFKVSVRR